MVCIVAVLWYPRPKSEHFQWLCRVQLSEVRQQVLVITADGYVNRKFREKNAFVMARKKTAMLNMCPK